MIQFSHFILYLQKNIPFLRVSNFFLFLAKALDFSKIRFKKNHCSFQQQQVSRSLDSLIKTIYLQQKTLNLLHYSGLSKQPKFHQRLTIMCKLNCLFCHLAECELMKSFAYLRTYSNRWEKKINLHYSIPRMTRSGTIGKIY